MINNTIMYKCDKCGKITNSGGLISYPLKKVNSFAGVALLTTDIAVDLCADCAEELCDVINKFIIEDFVGCK